MYTTISLPFTKTVGHKGKQKNSVNVLLWNKVVEFHDRTPTPRRLIADPFSLFSSDEEALSTSSESDQDGDVGGDIYGDVGEDIGEDIGVAVGEDIGVDVIRGDISGDISGEFRADLGQVVARSVLQSVLGDGVEITEGGMECQSVPMKRARGRRGGRQRSARRRRQQASKFFVAMQEDNHRRSCFVPCRHGV